MLEHLGDVHAAAGETAQAREQWNRALELYREQGRDTQAAALQARL
ncbi:hypothetical protein AB0M48_04150 [Lentzea sp. NPDC051208]